MSAKEAKARIKINRLLEDSGWRFFDDKWGKANIVLEPNVPIVKSDIDAWGENFEKDARGYIDFLLLDRNGKPLIVLEAKSEDKSPLIGKEQARTYAKSQNCRFIILSNGNVHYFWDLEQGNPQLVTVFPTETSIKSYETFEPDAAQLTAEKVEADYIVLTQLANYKNEAGWKNDAERGGFIQRNKLRFLRQYQMNAVHSIQRAVFNGKNRFLFEMATGTGKTLTSAAVIKLFLKSGNAKRVLFLVDRLELERQAQDSFRVLLAKDYKSVIYKEAKDDWRKADIVVTTVQSLMSDDKYKRLFSPTDFDFVISDEAHRSVNGNARAIFEYFIGYKLGLTATPKDYLKNFDKTKPTTRDPREVERRLMLDTYRTFGCETGEPTFRYTLLDGVKDGFLINPVVVDARTDITAQLLSEQGYAVMQVTEDQEDEQQSFFQRDFEKKFFSEATNRVFCEAFLKNALRDPVSGELGKSIVFAVSQFHATKLVQILNEIAHEMFPGKYQSDFAIQVTSQIPQAQQFTLNFANNNLSGNTAFREDYKTGKTRVCVTVGMMTTGYDCPDILNLALMRPIFSPSDFVQIKGRGTRKHNFAEQITDPTLKEQHPHIEKTQYKLFDFFANCEYFEEKFNYDQVLQLPKPETPGIGGEPPQPPPPIEEYISTSPDALVSHTETQIGLLGMKIDRMFFQKFERIVQADRTLKEKVESEQWDQAIVYLKERVLDKPEEYFTLEKLRKAAGVDRRLSLKEVLEKAFGLIPGFKSKNDILEEEFQKFLLDHRPDCPEALMAMKYYFKAYATDAHLRDVIDAKDFSELNVNATLSMAAYKDVPEEWRAKIPEYVKDYVPLNQFM